MSQKKDKQKLLFFRESVFVIAEIIFNYPSKIFHLRMLEKEAGFSITAVTDAIEELKKYNIVTVESTPLTKNVKANLESDTYYFYKKIFNLYRLEKYGLISNLKQAFRNPEAIVLFGSYAKGEDIENSDIDILIITNIKDNPLNEESLLNWEKKLCRKINFHIMKNIEKSSTEFKNSVANGMVLHGYIKVI